jgi:hypothetical protein
MLALAADCGWVTGKQEGTELLLVCRQTGSEVTRSAFFVVTYLLKLSKRRLPGSNNFRFVRDPSATS